MEDNSLPTILSIVSTLGFLALGFLQWRSVSRVNRADVVNKIGDTYDGLLDRLNSRIKELENRVGHLETELRLYVNWSAKLVRQLTENGIEPVKRESEPKIMAVKKKDG